MTINTYDHVERLRSVRRWLLSVGYDERHIPLDIAAAADELERLAASNRHLTDEVAFFATLLYRARQAAQP